MRYEVWAAMDLCPDSVPFYQGENKTDAANYYWTLVLLEFTNVHIVLYSKDSAREARPVHIPRDFAPVDLDAVTLCCVCGSTHDACACICSACGVHVYDDIALYDHGQCSRCYTKKRV